MAIRTCPYCAESIDETVAICPYCRRSVPPVVHASAGEAPQVPPGFRMWKSLLWTFLGFTLTVLLIGLASGVCLFYPVAGLVAGLTVSGVLAGARRETGAVPTRLPIIAGWTLAWTLTLFAQLLLQGLDGSEIATYLVNIPELLMVPIAMGFAVEQTIPGSGLKVWGFWLLAYVANLSLYVPFDVLGTVEPGSGLSLLMTVLGNFVLGLLGMYLTLREVTRRPARRVAPHATQPA